MKTPMLAAASIALCAVACGGTESIPDVYPQTQVPSSWEVAPAYPGELTSDQQLTLSGRLEGTLRGIALSADTTENYGSYTAYEGSPAYFSASIAARGDGGAGMLMISLTDSDLGEKLLEGHAWDASQSTTEGDTYTETSSSVASCAGPVIGEWPYEIGASDYEMDAAEDPAQPGTVVLTVKAQFPRSESDASSTTELTGTLRFALPAAAP
jgi:hypothetical protein